MFDLKEFIKKGLMDAVGKLPDYQVVLIAAYWFDKHVLNEADMTDIAATVNAAAIAENSNNQHEIPTDITYDYGLGEPPDEAFFG